MLAGEDMQMGVCRGPQLEPGVRPACLEGVAALTAGAAGWAGEGATLGPGR